MSALSGLLRPYTRKELLDDSRWLLLFAAAMAIQSGLVQAILLISQKTFFIPGAFIIAGFAAIVMAWQPFYWLRFLSIVAMTLALSWDLTIRLNPFGAPFVLVGLYYMWKMLLYHKAVDKISPVAKGAKKNDG